MRTAASSSALYDMGRRCVFFAPGSAGEFAIVASWRTGKAIRVVRANITDGTLQRRSRQGGEQPSRRPTWIGPWAEPGARYLFRCAIVERSSSFSAETYHGGSGSCIARNCVIRRLGDFHLASPARHSRSPPRCGEHHRQPSRSVVDRQRSRRRESTADLIRHFEERPTASGDVGPTRELFRVGRLTRRCSGRLAPSCARR